MRVSVEKPGTPEELVLEHHGVKGMHWGQRRAIRKAANRKFNQKNPTSVQRTRSIQIARANQLARKQKFKNEHDPVKRKELKEAFLNNPDRATSRRLTRGQKALVAGAWLSGIGTLPLAAVVGTRVVQRHRAERRLVK